MVSHAGRECQEPASRPWDEEPWRAMAGTQPLLCEKPLQDDCGWRDQQVDLASLFTAGAERHEINICLMGKAALRKMAQGGEGKPSFQVCQAQLQNSKGGCLRQFEGEEG